MIKGCVTIQLILRERSIFSQCLCYSMHAVFTFQGKTFAFKILLTVSFDCDPDTIFQYFWPHLRFAEHKLFQSGQCLRWLIFIANILIKELLYNGSFPKPTVCSNVFPEHSVCSAIDIGNPLRP